MSNVDSYSSRYSRRSILKVSGFGLIGSVLIAACGDDDEETEQPPAEGGGAEPELKLVTGWYKGREVKYYDFGANTKLAQGSAVQFAPIYAMIRGMKADGSPELVDGQGNIIDVKPGDAGYSDLWQVTAVMVPADYRPNALKSRQDVMGSGYVMTQTNMFVNCPVVAEGTRLEGGEKLVQGWYRSREVFYPDFGANPAAAIPIWAFATGVDASGKPQLVQGQNNIIDSVPRDPGYSAFWRVNLVMVPQSYQANAIKSADEVRSSGYATTQTEMVVNCPVTVA
jgi:hypothetical protein